MNKVGKSISNTTPPLERLTWKTGDKKQPRHQDKKAPIFAIPVV
jgi:hypothetical protein